ncbi:DnaJ protein-like protein [Smittium culicis]|uniref:DnaJ protein-like protein n=1 Tax=Smittium culicis TaxID=133412 RepID=A0A1R1YNT7_9FUNG|nr:DnaJ protein-like protein [Smittium culicis]
MGKDYYSILGVDKSASDDELKKAYRKMALKWHPDRHKGSDKDLADTKFKEISEAFEVLSDKQKRTIYDQYGEEALKNGMPQSAAGSGGPGSSFFGFPGGSGTTFSFSSSGGMPSGSFGGFTPSNPEDIFQQIFMDGAGGIFMGGSGGSKKSGRSRAHPGSSHMHQSMNSGSDFMSQFSSTGAGQNNGIQSKEIEKTLPVTLKDLYTGASKKLKVTRRIMENSTGQLNTSEKILQIDIKPGWKSGTKVRFSGEGDNLGNGPQDIVILINEKPDTTFKRSNNDLVMNIELSLLESLTGYKKPIHTLDGRTIEIENKSSIVHPGKEVRVAGEGMPISKTPGKKGDLIINFSVKFPTYLTEIQKAKLKEIL